MTAPWRVLAFLPEERAMAALVVELPAPLHRAAGGVGEVEVEGDTVAAALGSLRVSHPAAARLFLDDSGRPRRGVSLFLDGADLRTLAGLDTPIEPRARLAVVLLASGG